MSAGIDSKGSIPPAYVAWRAGTITLFLLGSEPPMQQLQGDTDQTQTKVDGRIFIILPFSVRSSELFATNSRSPHPVLEFYNNLWGLGNEQEYNWAARLHAGEIEIEIDSWDITTPRKQSMKVGLQKDTENATESAVLF